MEFSIKPCRVDLANVGVPSRLLPHNRVDFQEVGVSESIHVTGRKTRKCEHCSYTSDRKSNMSAHVTRMHRDETGATMPFCCAICDETFCAKQDLTRHINLKHSAEGLMDEIILKSDDVAINLLNNKLMCIDRLMAISVETFFWVLPSNRFSNGPELRYAERLRAREILRQSLENPVDLLMKELVPRSYSTALGENRMRYTFMYLSIHHIHDLLSISFTPPAPSPTHTHFFATF